MKIKLFEGNDLTVELTELKDGQTGKLLLGATVSVTLKDQSGTNLTGATFPLNMAYVANSRGNYRVILPAAIVMVEDDLVDVIIAATDSGITGEWFFDKVKVRKRTE